MENNNGFGFEEEYVKNKVNQGMDYEMNPEMNSEVDYQAGFEETDEAKAVSTKPADETIEKKPVDKRILISAIVGGMAIVGIIVLIVVMLLGGKDDEGDKDKYASGDVTVTISPEPSKGEEPTATPEPTLSPTPTPTPVDFGYSNPLEIEGLEYYEDKEVSDGLKLAAKLDSEAKLGEKYFTNVSVYSYDGVEAMLGYQLYDELYDNAHGEGDGFEETLDCYLKKISEEGSEGLVYDGFANYLQVLKNTVVLKEYSETATISHVYDKELEFSHEFVGSSSEIERLTEDGIRRYCVKEGNLFCEYKDASSRMVDLEDSIEISYIDGIVTDENGTDYICLSGEGADLEHHTFIINGTTGETVYVADYEYAFCTIEDNTYIETQWDDITYISNRWIVSRGDKSYDFNYSGEDYVGYQILDSGDLFFTIVEGKTVTMYLYSIEEGELIGLAELEVEGAEVSEDYYGEDYGEEAFLYNMPVDMGNGSYLLTIQDLVGNTFFYTWEPSVDKDVDCEFEISEYVKGERPSLEIEPVDDYEYLSNTELSAELLSLREKADEIEDIYGIEIFIGEECAGFLGGYACYPLLDYEKVETALNTFEAEISRYPENFFEQMDYDDSSVIEFYLAGTIKGMGDGGLSYAGGFQMEEGNRIILYIDSEYESGVAITLHHELFHAIEDYLVHMYYTGEGTFSEDEWDELNEGVVIAGQDSPYTYSYSQFGYDGCWDYTYYGSWDAEDFDDVYFIDDYSMTYPHEDRARIFEWAMNPYASIDFDEYPHLEAKLNYLAECIRECFDTTGWEDVPWEAYLD